MEGRFIILLQFPIRYNLDGEPKLHACIHTHAFLFFLSSRLDFLRFVYFLRGSVGLPVYCFFKGILLVLEGSD